MCDLGQPCVEITSHTLSWRIRRDKLGVRLLDRVQLVKHRVVLGIGDEWRAEDGVPVIVKTQLLAQCRRALGECFKISLSVCLGYIWRFRSHVHLSLINPTSDCYGV